MTRVDIESFFAGYQQAMMRHDAAAVAAHHAGDGLLESPWAGAVKGRSAIEQMHRAWFAAFPDTTYDSQELLIDGERIAWLVHLAGTDRGGFMGLPPSGKLFHCPVVLLCTLRDGLIVRDQRIYDFTGLLIQIGVLKARPV